jgi:hypothetical protein
MNEPREDLMNGYRDLARRHRRELAAVAHPGEHAAVPRFNWVVAAVEGVAEAAYDWSDRRSHHARHTGSAEAEHQRPDAGLTHRGARRPYPL